MRLMADRKYYCVIKDILHKSEIPIPVVYLTDRVIFYWDKLHKFSLDHQVLSDTIQGELFVDCYFHEIKYGYQAIFDKGQTVFWQEANSETRKDKIFLSQIQNRLGVLV